MNYWIFKVSKRGGYPDTPGKKYVYDNTHSVRVEAGDEFIYLEKHGTKYGLTGGGRVHRVEQRAAKDSQRHSIKVQSVFTAHLTDVVWFSKLFDLSTQTIDGRRNRQAVGLPKDLNRIGWSISMPRIERDQFVCLVNAALDAGPGREQKLDHVSKPNWRVDDSWSLVRQRSRMQMFRAVVLERHNYTCLVCGTRLRSVLDAAHIRSFAADAAQRANPANGICLCTYCHAAYDSGDLAILPDGSVAFNSGLQDEIALKHFSVVSPKERIGWLEGVNHQFLLERVCQE